MSRIPLVDSDAAPMMRSSMIFGRADVFVGIPLGGSVVMVTSGVRGLAGGSLVSEVDDDASFSPFCCLLALFRVTLLSTSSSSVGFFEIRGRFAVGCSVTFFLGAGFLFFDAISYKSSSSP